jgi:hypothetical protein
VERDRPKTWREIRGARAVDEDLVAYYRRVSDANRSLEALRIKRGVSEQRYDAAQLLDASTGEQETDDLARFARSVAVLGGRLEVRAIFSEETVTLMLEPDPADGGAR